MKKLLLGLFVFMFAIVTVGEVVAAERYFGLKAGVMMLDKGNVDDIIPIGAVYSHRLDKIITNLDSKNLWFEGEFN